MIKYIDTTDASNSELLYIRTLESDRYENVVKSGTGNYFKTKSVTTKGYNFQNMSATVYEFSQDGTSDSLIDQYTTILIKLNNLENEDLSKYDITLYTAGRYDWSNLIGSRYRLQLNNDGAEIPGTTQIDEIFGVGYFTAGMSDVGSQIKKIDIPKKSTQAFLGYYYKQNGTSPEVQVVDAEGTIVTTSRFFRDDIERNLAQDINSSIIIAKWANCEGGYVIVDGVCKPKTFTVVLNKNGGNPDKGTNSYTVNYNTKVRDIQIPQRAGYEFKGYNKGSEQFHDKDGKGTIIFKYTMNLTGDESPIAQWTL